MENSVQSINRLLEHYLFSAASQYIHLADERTQNQLINFMQYVDVEATSIDTVPFPGQTLLMEWEQVLHQVIGDDH